jgi:hypothetical protein
VELYLHFPIGVPSLVLDIRLLAVQPVKIKLFVYLIKHHAYREDRALFAIFYLGTRWR